MNKKVIRTICLVLVLISMLTFGVTAFATSLNQSLSGSITNTLKEAEKDIVDTVVEAISDMFSDIKGSEWYVSTVEKLVNLGGISGYPDGTFKADNQMTRAEFTKTLVSALGYTDIATTSGNHWASGYVDKAVEIGLVSNGELSDLNSAITRKEMAKMVANSLDHLGEEQVSDRIEYKSQITDYNTINASYQDFVLKAYTKGIITGYTDGEFKADRGLTRAEASTVVMRVIDKAERKLPSESVTTPIEEPKKDLKDREINIKLPKGVKSVAKHQNPQTTEELKENIESLKEYGFGISKRSNWELIAFEQFVSDADEHRFSDMIYGIVKMETPNDLKLSTADFEGVTYDTLTSPKLMNEGFTAGFFVKDGEILGKISKSGNVYSLGDENNDYIHKADYIMLGQSGLDVFTNAVGFTNYGERIYFVFDNPFQK